MKLYFYLGTLLVCLPSADASEWVVQKHQSTAEFKSWGKDCPPKPKATANRRGHRYTQRNQQLIPQGRAYPIFSDGVCSKATGLVSLQETRSRQGFSCTTPEGVSPSLRGRITMNDRDGGKDVRHTMEYDWRLHGSHCHLIQREAWQLRIVQPEPESTRAADKAKCATPGKTKRISVRKPNALRIQSGQTLRIQAWPVDAGATTKDASFVTNGGQMALRAN